MYTIIAKTPLSHNVSRMEILAPPVARKALPGQFVILRAMEHSERIPLTVHDVNTQSGTVSMVYQVVGAGTRELDSLKAGDSLHAIGETFRVKRIAPVEDRLRRRGSGRRGRTRTSEKQGRYVRSQSCAECRDLALDATLRAAAPHQCRRRADSRVAVVIHREDWREKVREKRIGSFILFVVDASGSMGARGRMVAAKGAVMSLLLDAYQKRDTVAMITFRRREAALALPPTASIDMAGTLLRALPVGGRTPLAAGLAKAYETLSPALRRDPTVRPLVILVSDGKANVGLDGGNGVEDACRLAERLGQDARVRWVVVDTEEPQGVRLRLAHRIALALGADYFHVEDLRATDLVQVAKGQG